MLKAKAHNYSEPCGSALMIADTYGPLIRSKEVEHVLMLSLDGKYRCLGIDLLGKGSINTCLCSTREVARTAIKNNASNVVLMHNHPSGDVSPSEDDIKLTDSVWRAMDILGIHLCDHIIVGGSDYYSFQDAGILA